MEELLKRYPVLKSCAEEIEKTAEILISGFKAGNKLLLCGNGGLPFPQYRCRRLQGLTLRSAMTLTRSLYMRRSLWG